jgi:ABC-type phosphate transport system auxiliary subunit
MSMLPRHAILLSAAFLLGGCEVVTELGKPCVLVRKANASDPEYVKDSKTQVAVQLKERELTAGQDFISFGSLDCEEQVCVRDAAVPPGTNPDAVALGYCSRPCIEESSSCEVTNEEVDTALRERMTCRQMMLDDEALNRLKASNPEEYRALFGTYENSGFCAGRLTPAAPGDQRN